ncbi:N/A [soil metagenome]
MTNRILHLIPTLMSGGAERQLVNVVGSTSPEDFTHLVCTLNESGFYAPLIREKGYEVRELGINGKRPWFKAAPKFAEVVREYEPDLINTWLYDANITGRIAKLRGSFKTPLVTSLQATDYEPETIRSGNWSPKKVEVLRQIDKITMRLTQPYFVACSKFVQTSFEKRLGIPPKKTRMIYNAVNPESLICGDEAPQKVRQELNIPDDAFVYLNIGRLDPQKNQLRLLEAFARILPSLTNAYLMIVGAGRLEGELKDLVKTLGIEKNVRLIGRRKDVGACLSAADVFVFPSLFEGLPLALVEAMFKSLPCIAGDIEVLREVITDGKDGLLVNPHEISEIAAAMIKLFEQPKLCRQLGEQALKEVETNFHAKVTAIEWEDFYRQIISEES